jgi:60 kDa SS-A/Ro ribonucleoprotein
MTIYGETSNKLVTPQRDQADSRQVKNNAGGYTFTLDCWKRLDRFLILGCEGGTYYVDEKAHVKQAVTCIAECLKEDGARTVRRIVEISDAGRAPKNDPAIFALAVAAGDKNPATRAAANAALPAVARIGTHLFHFVADVEGQRRWGRSLRRAVGRWYTERSAESLALQAVKYQQRDGWSHRDLLRLAHPVAPTKAHDAIFRYVTGGIEAVSSTRATTPKEGMPRKYEALNPADLPKIIVGFEMLKKMALTPAIPKALIAQTIVDYGLPHECVPNELKSDPLIWHAMLPHMGQTALLRNLAKMTSIGLLRPLDETTRDVAARLCDLVALKKGRVHPLSILFAMTTYISGHGLKGSLAWQPVREIVDALDAAFYAAFDAVEPTGKNHLLALDVSGSMSANIGGTNLSCREASAAMALVTAKVEKNWHCVGFTSPSGRVWTGYHGGGGASLKPLSISPQQRLGDAVRSISNIPFGGTDCSLPMLYAAGENLSIDTFVVYTDNETWAGNIHPHQALRAYREKSGINAKLIVVGMTATEFTIADPSDAGMLDVAGFDAAVPALMADFSREG